MTKTAFALGLLLAGTQATGATHFHANLAYAYGGDELATVYFTDGSNQSLRAGSGFSFNLGAAHSFTDSPFSMRLTLGYQADSTTATNSNARFSRYPLELLGFWHHDVHRLGGGLTRHFSPSLDLDNLGGRIDFEDAGGFLLEYGYEFSPGAGFAIRYTTIDYTADGFTGEVDGNSLGVALFGEF